MGFSHKREAGFDTKTGTISPKPAEGNGPEIAKDFAHGLSRNLDEGVCMSDQPSQQGFVKDLMTAKITTVSIDTSAHQAAEQMKGLNLGFLPVIDYKGRVVGIITDRDLAIRAVTRNILPRELLVETIMSTDPVCCAEDTFLNEALKLMEVRHVRRIVVVDDEKRPVGILSLADLAMKYAPATLQLYTRIAKKVRAEQDACWQ